MAVYKNKGWRIVVLLKLKQASQLIGKIRYKNLIAICLKSLYI